MKCIIRLACVAVVGTVICPAARGADLGALQADRALSDALAKSNRTLVASLLDDEFAWTEADGKTRTKAEALEHLPELLTDNQGDSDIQTHDFGQVERIVGVHHGDRFVRLWVKRPTGWRAFILIDVPIPANGYSNHPSPVQHPGKDCVNPCKVLPYTPQNAAQEGAMQSWLVTKMDEWHAIKTDWPKHISDTMVVISPTMWFNKAGRLDLLAKQYDAYGDGNFSPAVESMRMFDFGDAVIMTAIHAPGGPSGKRAYAVRMFVKERDGWKGALSAQTDIKDTKNP